MKQLMLIGLFLSMCSVCTSQTVDIPLSNSSFEIQRFAQSGLADNSWWLYGPTVAFEPDGSFMATNYPGQSLPDGLTIIRMGQYAQGGFFGQPLPITLQQNTVYNFTVYVGSRTSDPFDPDPTWGEFFGMRLKIDDGSQWGGATIKKVWSGNCYPEGYYYDVPAVTGQFVPMTLTLDSATITDPNLFGKPLVLCLEAGEVVVDFDKITATMSSANITGVPVTINTTPAGINTVNILGTHTYAVGTSLYLRADWLVDCPEVYKFDHWEINGAFFSNEQEIVLNIDSAKNITAVYDGSTSCQTMAYDIPVVNGDFEYPGWHNANPDPEWVTTAMDYPRLAITTSVSGWRIYNLWNLTWASSNVYYMYPGGWELFFPGVAHSNYGDQVGWTSNGCGFEQDLNYSLQESTTYTINFDLGWAVDTWAIGDGWIAVELLAGDNKVLNAGIGFTNGASTGNNNVYGSEYGMAAVARKNWAHETLTYTTNSSSVGIGQPLKLRFFGGTYMIDNVSVTASSVTAPVTLIMSTSSNGGFGPDTVIPTVGQHTYPYGSKVNVTASKYSVCPNVYRFDHWTGDVNDATAAATFVSMDDDRAITGVFANGAICGDECHPINSFDFDSDCDVDLHDLAKFAQSWHQSFGELITIVNGDFESPVITPVADVTYGYTATGWTASMKDIFGNPGYADRSRVLRANDAGWDWNYFGNNATAYYAPGGMEVPRTPYGEQVESSFLGNGWSQELSAALAANTGYVLTYDVGFGKDSPVGAAAYRIQLFAGDVIVMEVGEGWGAGVVGAEFGQVAGVYNNWTHQRVSFVTDTAPVGLNSNLKIKIWSDGGVRTDNYTLKACSGLSQSDLDGDCDVDLNDLGGFAQSWLECTSPTCD